MKVLFTFWCVIMCLGAMSQATIGDVKYSILEPAKFMELNPGWVLMDGGASHLSDSLFKVSALHTQMRLPALPDARGIFIRGMNMGRSADDGDPDGDASIVRYQKDGLKDHLHTIRNFHSGVVNVGGTPNWGVSILNPADPNVAPNGTEDFTTPGVYDPNRQRVTQSETRPRNIALYVYIKIN